MKTKKGTSRKKKRPLLDRQSVKRRKKRDYGAFFRSVPRIGFGFLKGFVILALVGGISAGFLFFYQALLDSPYMKLESIVIHGLDQKLKAQLIEMSGLNAKTSLLSLKLDDLKTTMETHPWIRSVHLERRLPNTLIVEAEKQAACALVLMDRLYYMNTRGEIFREVYESDHADYPIVTGVSSEIPVEEARLDVAAKMIQALAYERGLWSLEELSEIHLEEGGEMSLYFNHVAAQIKMTCCDLEAGIEGLRKVSDHLNRTGRIHHVTAIDLNPADGAVVSFRKG